MPPPAHTLAAAAGKWSPSPGRIASAPDRFFSAGHKNRQQRFARGFDGQVPIGIDPENLARFDLHSSWEGNSNFAPLFGSKTAAHPAAFFPGQQQPIVFFAAETGNPGMQTEFRWESRREFRGESRRE